LSENDMAFLLGMTRAVMDSSRIFPGQVVSPQFGPNASGITLIRPGGGGAYPAFWIRDYAMALESGLVPVQEQRQMLLFTAARQCDRTFATSGGLVPVGAVPDHIRIDDLQPIFFPGTYDVLAQGDGTYGKRPPYCDQFYFIHMAYAYLKSTGNSDIFRVQVNGQRLLDRLILAFDLPQSRPGTGIVFTEEADRAVDFGFRDAVVITGDLCFSSLQKYKAALELAYCFDELGAMDTADRFRATAKGLKPAIRSTFMDEQGMLRASTGISRQPDVWATALAVHENVLEGKDQERASHALADAYRRGALTLHGNIRHVPTTGDFNDTKMWERAYPAKGTYQNGAYWGTPVGWVCSAIAHTDIALARKLAAEYISDLRIHDFRKGGDATSPVECFRKDGTIQNPLYMATVACPYGIFLNWHRKGEFR